MNNTGVDGESLQADVMRFMAIIGFCLVAIMALVRDVNPPSNLQVELAEPAPAAAANSEAGEINQVVQRVTVIETPKPKPKPKPLLRSVPVAAIAAPPRAMTASLTPLEQATPSEQATASEPAEQEQGLSLRFHSDQDFLRLITSGEVSVYLFKDQTAFRLARSYVFQEAPAPRQLYELLPQTIPAAISASADASVSDLARFKWGVAMPARIEKRIASLVAVESNGQLVIDRFGVVRHEPAAQTRDPQVLNAGRQG